MGAVMTHIWNIGVQTAIIFGALLIVRGLFSLCRVPKKYAYALWAILFVRLLIPFQPETAFGLMPQSGWTPGWVRQAGEEQVLMATDSGVQNGAYNKISPPGTRNDAANSYSSPGLWGGANKAGNFRKDPSRIEGEKHVSGSSPGLQNNIYSMLSMRRLAMFWESLRTAAQSRQPRCSAERWLTLVWAIGATGVFLYSVTSYIRLKKKVRCCIRLKKEVGLFTGDGGNQERRDSKRGQESWQIYLADHIDMPFVMGILSPRIYIPSSLEERNLPYVIAHEQTHIRRGDYLVKLAAFLIAGFYWYLPVVWLGFLFMSRDMEMSCDEAVIKGLGEENRGVYADSLLRLSYGRRYPVAMPLAFSGGNMEERIRNIMKYKKPVAPAAVFGVALIVVLAAVLLTGRRISPEKSEGGPEPELLTGRGISAQKNEGGLESDSEADFGPEAEQSNTNEQRPISLFDELTGSSASYDDSTTVTIDGTIYDLAEGNFMVNAVMGMQCVGGLWIVEGHINPNVGSYSVYDIRTGTWEKDIVCSHLTWDAQAGAIQEDDIRDTIVYELNNEICNYNGELIGKIELEAGEYIGGLLREGNVITVRIRSNLELEDYGREVQLTVSETTGR